jgi:ABC-2 type transport system permease protein
MRGLSYIEFVLPGILMMNVLTSAFSHSSSSLYFQRFARHIEEILVAPLSYTEMIAGYITGALVRGVLIGVGMKHVLNGTL